MLHQEEIRKEAESKSNQAEKELEHLRHNEMQHSSLQDKQKIIDSLNLQIAQANDTIKKANEAIATAEQAQNSQK